MKKELVVRKSKAHRQGIFITFVIMVVLSVLATILFHPIYYWGLISLIGVVPVLCILLYYHTWRISLSSKCITVQHIFRRTKSYTYSQVIDGYIANSFTLYRHVCLTFYDGKRLRFRMEDENAGRAVKTILSHHSLRSLNW